MVDILSIPNLPSSHSDYFKLLAIKKDLAVSAVAAGLKADENRFRRRQNDVIARLFEVVRKDNKLIEQPPA